MSERHYKAFISYSHADKKWANWLLNQIESYRVPAQLVGQVREGKVVPARISPLFKDREELSSSADLTESVSHALANSDALIVVCSPHAKESHWVNSEIRQFKMCHGDSRVYSFIVSGDETTAFPPALSQSFNAEGEITHDSLSPLGADIHPDADGRQNAKLKIVSALINVSFDELKRRDLAKRYRRLSYITMAASFLVALLLGLSIYAYKAEQKASYRKIQAENLIEFMIGDLRQRLQPIGRLDVLEDVGKQAMTYFETIDSSGENAVEKSQRGKVFQQLGEIQFLRGNLEQAQPLFLNALEIQKDAFVLSPDSSRRYELSQANFWVGYSFSEAGEFDQALPFFLRYREHSEALAAIDPLNMSWHLESAYADINLGTLYWERENYQGALAAFAGSTKTLATMLQQWPDKPLLRTTQVASLGWLAGTYRELGNNSATSEVFGRQVDLARSEQLAEPNDYNRKEAYSLALMHYGQILVNTGDIAMAETVLREALIYAQDLNQREPENFYWRHGLAKAYWYYGELLEVQSRPEQAINNYQQSDVLFRSIDSKNKKSKWKVEHSRLSNDIAILLRGTGDSEGWLKKSYQLLESSDQTRMSRYTSFEARLIDQCINGKIDLLELRSMQSGLIPPGELQRDDFVAISLVVRQFLGSREHAQYRVKPNKFEVNKFSACL